MRTLGLCAPMIKPLSPEPEEFAGEALEYSEAQKRAARISRLREEGTYICFCDDHHDNGAPPPRPVTWGRNEDY